MQKARHVDLVRIDLFGEVGPPSEELGAIRALTVDAHARIAQHRQLELGPCGHAFKLKRPHDHMVSICFAKKSRLGLVAKRHTCDPARPVQ